MMVSGTAELEACSRKQRHARAQLGVTALANSEHKEAAPNDVLQVPLESARPSWQLKPLLCLGKMLGQTSAASR